jgi:saccharopine dehydrogenase-like NADP-dependent oxidoreductase
MSYKAVVLGCGLVGATIARDLADDADFDVTVADASEKNLGRAKAVDGLTPLLADLSSPERIKEIIADCDVVLGAMPSSLGFMVLRSVIEARKPFSDISFMAEDAMELDELARANEVSAVVDCGVAPGLANLMIGHCHYALDRTDRVTYYVGGLPKHPKPPYFYKAPFAPLDVIEEYTRPARMREEGELVTKPALSEPEELEFPRVGKLIAFNTDGLRSLLKTIAAPNMVEKTLRHPGHIELMEVFRETGFFGKEPIDVRGASVRPIDVTAKLLFPHWQHEQAEDEFTVMRVIVEGQKAGRAQKFVYDLYDEYEPISGQSSMARTTGFPCAIVARMLARGEIKMHGVLPPELLGKQPGMLDHMTRELTSRGVRLSVQAQQG